MRLGSIIGLPNAYSQFARIKDQYGNSYTADPSLIPKGMKEGDSVAYKVEIGSNDSGLVYEVKED